MINPNPECNKECRFKVTDQTRTCAYYEPVFDKNGNNLNPDRNVTTSVMSCSVCSKQWKIKSRFGEETVIEEMK